MEAWEVEDRIKYLEALNEDPMERPEVKANRGVHIEFYKKKLNEIRNREIPSDTGEALD